MAFDFPPIQSYNNTNSSNVETEAQEETQCSDGFEREEI
jgi:hypothetical protein